METCVDDADEQIRPMIVPSWAQVLIITFVAGLAFLIQFITQRRYNQLVCPHSCARIGDLPNLLKYLEAGGNPNQLDEKGWTPLHYSCRHGNTMLTEVLLDFGADINQCAPGGGGPLALACGAPADADAAASVRLLLLRAAPAEGAAAAAAAEAAAGGISPLHEAVLRGYREGVGSKQRTAFIISEYSSILPRRQYMSKAAAALLTHAMVTGGTGAVQQLVATLDEYGNTPLAVARSMGHQPLVDLLLPFDERKKKDNRDHTD